MSVQINPHSALRFNARTRGQAPAAPVRFGGPLLDTLTIQTAGETLDQVGQGFKIAKYTFYGAMGSLIGGLGYFLSIHQINLRRKKDAVVAQYEQQVKNATPEEHKALVAGLLHHKNHYVQAYAAENIPDLPDNVADRCQKIAWLKELGGPDVAGMGRPAAQKSLEKMGLSGWDCL